MPRIYKISRTGLRLIYKVRHHRGHGIHSPFVFNLINKVIEEKLPYYAFNDIKAYVNLLCGKSPKTDKINRLSFRLMNYFNVESILEIGSGTGLNTLFLTAPDSKIVCRSIESDIKKRAKLSVLYDNWNRQIQLYSDLNSVQARKTDCIYINLKNYKVQSEELTALIKNCLYENSFIVVEGIRTNRKNKIQWERIKNLDNRTIVLDLFNIGIVFFNPTLYPWEYKISF